MAQTRKTIEVLFPQWMERPWSSHTICCCSAIKEIRLSSHQKTWRGHKCIVLSKRSQCGKPYMFYDSNRIFWKKQSSKNDQRLSGVWGGRPGIDRRRLFLRQTLSSVYTVLQCLPLQTHQNSQNEQHKDRRCPDVNYRQYPVTISVDVFASPCSTLTEAVNHGELNVSVGGGSAVLAAQSIYSPKSALKVKEF